ncbi:RCC1 domain-containing protein [Polyangium aurulentum]|uniref:RCC1 domain-containing protein n=1 Tax=Polyangium aurulentum TaxID=2567896 RepID=UPI00146C433E|nr:hypothetical protein [Polyangium aurulentum]UQA60910.1 hypothetical protein E8A73_010680 [Polyangium aurulentum]
MRTHKLISVVLFSSAALTGCMASEDPLSDELVAEATQAVSVVLDVRVGGSQAFVRVDNDALYGWGANGSSQLGDGTTTNRSAPIHIVDDIIDVAGSTSHSCAVSGAGLVYCFGSNGYNKAGDGSWYTTKATPTQVLGVSDAVAIATGAEHSCAVLASGTVSCWGHNGYKQLGDNSSVQSNATPVAVSGLSDAIAIDAGSYSTCVLRASGNVSCWGNNGLGQLGDGTMTTRATPVAVSGVSNATAIARGSSHGCALLADGTVVCWGSNSYGQLGLGVGSAAYATTPQAVPGLANIVAIGAGTFHTCAVRDDGAAFCWGLDDRQQIGDGNTSGNHHYAPNQVPNLGGSAVSIDGGDGTTCARLSTGTVKCWGSDSSGTLGNGGTLPGSASSTPVTVALP